MPVSETHLFSLIDRSGRFTSCWLWGGHITSGVAVVYTDAGMRSAARVVWELVKNDILPRDTVLWPRCRFRTCVNPDHKDVVSRQTASARRFAANQQRLLDYRKAG